MEGDFFCFNRLIFPCGFPMCSKDTSGNLFYKNTITEQPHGTKENTLIQLVDMKNTGFIISVKNILINQENKKFALVLTAGHTIYNLKIFKSYYEDYVYILENQRFGKAHILKCFIYESPHELKSSFTSTNYYLPGDVAILLIEDIKGEIDNYEIATDILIGSDCIISGYPALDNLRNVLPQLENLSCRKKELKKIFCDFGRKVYAKGRVESENNGFIEVSCSATYGMSGSPIISGGKIVGIYTGGPPVPGQRDCVKILQKLERNENPAKILKDLKDLTKYDMYFTIPLYSILLDSSIVQDFEMIRKVMAGEELTQDEEKVYRSIYNFQFEFRSIVEELSNLILRNISDAAVYFENKDLFKANVGISINHEIFKFQIMRIINAFLDCTKFMSVDELVEHLKE